MKALVMRDVLFDNNTYSMYEGEYDGTMLPGNMDGSYCIVLQRVLVPDFEVARIFLLENVRATATTIGLL